MYSTVERSASTEPAFTSQPFILCSMKSGPALLSVVITGVPCDIASVITRPNPSIRVGSTRISFPFINCNTSACDKVSIHLCLLSATFNGLQSSSAFLPTKVSSISLSNLSTASSKVAMPLRCDNPPTNKILKGLPLICS